jgi:hypothetical protein
MQKYTATLYSCDDALITENWRAECEQNHIWCGEITQSALGPLCPLVALVPVIPWSDLSWCC